MRVIFNEAEHTYSLGDKTLISVTQLLKKHGLMTDYSGVDELLLKQAAAKGVIVHKEIEDYIKTGAIGFTSELSDYIRLADELSFKPHGSEIILPIGNIPKEDVDKYIYAGTADIIGECNGEPTLIDIKTTAHVNKRACSWQLSLYERLADVRFAKMFVLHLRDKSKVVPIERIPEQEIDRLLECERNGEIYKERGLIVPDELLESVQRAEMALVLAEKVKKEAEAIAKVYRAQLYEAMTSQGISSWETKDKSLLITRVAPSTKTTIDSEKLRADFPDFAEKYSKVSGVKGYVKITILEG